MDLRHVFLDKMPRCRNSSQIKEQGKVMARYLGKTGVSDTPDGEPKATIVKILKVNKQELLMKNTSWRKRGAIKDDGVCGVTASPLPNTCRF